MGTDERLNRGEHSGRYGSDNRRNDMDWHKRRSRSSERDYDRRRADDRRTRDRFDDRRDSPKRRRKRHHSDSSDDEYDADHPDQDSKMEPKKNTSIVLTHLPPNVTEDEVRKALEQLPGPQPVSVRVIGKITSKIQDIAIMEFYYLQDSARWMETNQNNLVILGKRIRVLYSKKQPTYKNWLCTLCGLCNFQGNRHCFNCGTVRIDGESPAVYSPSVESKQESDYSGETLIMTNIAHVSTIDGILGMLSPYAKLSTSNLSLIKDKHTGENKGFGFVRLSSHLEASQLLTVLQSLQPPLKLDGKVVAVDYARSVKRDGAEPDGVQANIVSAASTAIAAARWSSTLEQNNEKMWQQQQDGLSPVNGGGLPKAPSGKHTSPLHQATESQHIERVADAEQQRQQQQQQPASVHPASLPTPAASSLATPVPASPTVNMSAGPDVSSFVYDKASGYYCDPQTGLYYDPSSQFYYNSETQQYLYWDGEKQTYVVATEDMMEEEDSGRKEPKGKKKAKTKTAQEIVKNMERWAKSLNRNKKRSAVQDSGPSKEPSPGVYCNGDTITNWRALICLLCHRKFPTKEALLRHQQFSDLHKQKLKSHILELQRGPDAELSRREPEQQSFTDGAPSTEESHPAREGFYPPPVNYDEPIYDGSTADNYENNVFPSMAWHEGEARGYHHQQDIVAPSSALIRTMGTSMGMQSYESSPYNTYEGQHGRFEHFNRF